MKFSKAATFIALCAVSCLVVLPSVTNAQVETASSTTTEKPTPPTGTTSSKPAPTTISTPAVTPSTTSKPAPTTTATSNTPPPVVPHPTSTSAASKPPTVTSATSIPAMTQPLPSGTPVAGQGAPCTNSATCGAAFPICGFTTNNITATCQSVNTPSCMAIPQQTCVTNADCTNTGFSYCSAVPNVSGNICIGLGIPGVDECSNRPKSDNGSSLTPTIKVAGIAVGCVAALGLLFAGVRWQRRRQRSKVPENMFGEIDYGMTDRSSTPKNAEQNYPFSSRPHAHGSDNSPSPHDSGGHDNQYYDDGGYQKDQHYGNDQYNNGGYYGNQQDNYGYDHHSGHGGQGGFYDEYNDYPQNGGGGHHSPIATPAAAVMSPRQNGYGAEPSELDYGGHGGNGGYGNGGHGGGHGGQGGHY